MIPVPAEPALPAPFSAVLAAASRFLAARDRASFETYCDAFRAWERVRYEYPDAETPDYDLDSVILTIATAHNLWLPEEID